MNNLRTNVYDRQGRMRHPTTWAVYAIAADIGTGDLVVKIGMSSIPYERYATLLCGIPFPSMMKWAWVGKRWQAATIEKGLHHKFTLRNTAREWFLFKEQEKGELWAGFHEEIEYYSGNPPEWQVITEAQAESFRAQTAGKNKKA